MIPYPGRMDKHKAMTQKGNLRKAMFSWSEWPGQGRGLELLEE